MPIFLHLISDKMKRMISLMLIAIVTLSAHAARQGVPDFKWMKETGSKSFPEKNKVYYVNDFGALGDAIFENSAAIQETIDACSAAGGGIVSFHPGIYVTGSVFIKSNVNFNVPKGVMLVGSQDIADYKRIDTRIAGVEMVWPAALVNIIKQNNAAITGDGVINGKGKVFWDKYWTMRKEYDPRGLRWIVDYDCERPRGILISECENITIRDIVLYQPGFWSLHILYSQHVTVDDIIISNNIEGRGPSTDGIDIDSSNRILIQNSYINCNDDNFCLKAGRDADGIKVNRPCEYILIRNCVAGHGDGLFTCGSETSGGIRNVVAHNLKAYGTKYGLRFKSTVKRGGVIENIYLSNIEMIDVRNPFIVDLNWYPAYSNSLLPSGYDVQTIPLHWKKMIEDVDPKIGTPKFRNIYCENIKSTGASTSIKAMGIETGTLDNFQFKNASFEGKTTGSIEWANGWIFNNVTIKSTDNDKLVIKNAKNIKQPTN
jgi:hypothetical protein